MIIVNHQLLKTLQRIIIVHFRYVPTKDVKKKRVVYEKFIFYNRTQKKGELFNSFLVDVIKLGKTCEFRNESDYLMRDRIVFGIADKATKAFLLKRITQCHTMELITRNSLRTMIKRTSKINKEITVNPVVIVAGVEQYMVNEIALHMANNAAIVDDLIILQLQDIQVLSINKSDDDLNDISIHSV